MSKSTVAKNAAAIQDLQKEMAELKSNFENSFKLLQDRLDSLLLKEEQSNIIPVPDPEPEPVVENHDVLIIGDSIVSVVDPEVVDPDCDISVVCIRGGRPKDISTKFEEISQIKTFKRIVVHVGTNLIPRFCPDFVANDILKCLEKIKKLAPQSEVTFSCILPKTHISFLGPISYINRRVASAGMDGPARLRFGSLGHACNFMENGKVLTSHFKNDRIHLSLDGALAFNLGLNYLIGKN